MTTIEVTGRLQQQAWADKVLPPVEEVRPGLWSIPVPMGPNPLRYVLVYALALPDGGLALIDVGWPSDESWQALVDGIRGTGHDVTDVRSAAITHFHPDHFGLVPRLLEHTDAELLMHRDDACHLRYHSDDEVERQLDEARWELRVLGAPADVAGLGLVDFVRLPDGRTVDRELTADAPLDIPGWNLRAIWTPGHTPGHLCFADDDAGVIFTGDHLLPRISPNVSTSPMQTQSPLADYLVSLANTERMRDHEALPSHEYRFRGLGARVTGLLSHHEERLTEITEAVAARPESTAWEITQAVRWSRPFSDLNLTMKRLALRETDAHLLVLSERGILSSTPAPTEADLADDAIEPVRWSLATVSEHHTSSSPSAIHYTEENPQ
ncbi:MBL fold metallo-hydrolase [Gordonia amicalis]|uniref:MBL fold metallo-hydrolase n=1 Tax=Gordonia amicalis TaxID=89053 RepID=A0AAE4U889_9ACTN|nr:MULTISPECIES: MBL fold metallo-hydrolase [Gordonia]ATD70089.1 MBL fold metallo-hydrolase [Gordonia sp. 1D]MBA5849286.1 MBL fold metallo-hydrolase [Gordonia amicalis]MCZ4581661.1 MBL fold metallo-hydrolase [Gordonia amicalis]MDV6306896.1 MBL fold metallo-hydrolase [Gordonia amicalis]MDV6311088.1 MBL fold metallo-hydrolase [Gordonia amicalis]